MLNRLIKWRRRASPMPPPTPDQPLVVVGDVHGRADLLHRLPETAAGVQVVFVGDYIDRGENSADVLRILQAAPQVICLMGNHEEMMLRFIDAPDKHGPRWLRYGGLQTLASFSVPLGSETASDAALITARDALVEAMGDGLITWLRALPSSWQSGNVVVTHAGADPNKPIDLQDPSALRWGHPDFDRVRRTDGLWIAHGHTIVDAPVMDHGRINVDTGAYATGRLTMAHISAQGVNFETIS